MTPILIETSDKTVRVTMPGYHMGKAPDVKGWEPFFVAHFGHDRTVYTYRPTEEKQPPKYCHPSFGCDCV